MLRPYDAMRVIKEGEQRLMKPVARSTSLKQGCPEALCLFKLSH